MSHAAEWLAVDKRLSSRQGHGMDGTNKVAWSYVRHSTKEQATGDSYNRQSQRAKNWAEKNGYQLQEIYDNGRSGYTGENLATGQLGTFVAKLRAGELGKDPVLLIEAFDRLSREQIEKSHALFFEMANLGATLVILNSEKIYKSPLTAYDIIQATLEMESANRYSVVLSDRITRQYNKRKEDGKITHNKRNTPGWLKLGNWRDGWLTDPGRTALVQRIFQDAAAGMGPAAIARSLRTDNIPVWPNVKSWSPSYIQDLLQDRRLLGEYQREGEALNPIYFPAVVATDLFNKVNAERARTARGRGNGKIAESNLLRGLAVDANGTALIHRTSGIRNRKTGVYKYYPVLQGKGDKPLRVSYEIVEERILWLLAELGEELFQKIKISRSSDLNTRIASYEAQYKFAEAQIQKIMKVFLKHENPPDALVVELKKYEGEAQRAKEKIQEVTALVHRHVEKFKIEGDISQPEVRRAIRAQIAYVFDKIIVTKTHVDAYIFQTYGLRLHLTPPYAVTEVDNPDPSFAPVFKESPADHEAALANMTEKEKSDFMEKHF